MTDMESVAGEMVFGNADKMLAQTIISGARRHSRINAEPAKHLSQEHQNVPNSVRAKTSEKKHLPSLLFFAATIGAIACTSILTGALLKAARHS